MQKLKLFFETIDTFFSQYFASFNEILVYFDLNYLVLAFFLDMHKAPNC